MAWVLLVVFLLAEGVTETVQVPMPTEALCRAAEIEVKRVDALQLGLDQTVETAIQNPQYPVLTVCLQTQQTRAETGEDFHIDYAPSGEKLYEIIVYLSQIFLSYCPGSKWSP